MTIRDAFAQARGGTPKGWLLARWTPNKTCTLDTDAQFREVSRDPASNKPILPQDLAGTDWEPICDSAGLQDVLHRVAALSGKQDDHADLEAMLHYYLIHDIDVVGGTAAFAAETVVSRRKTSAS